MRKLTFLLLITGIAMDSSIYAQILYKDSTVIKTDKGYEAGKTTPNYKYTSAHDKSGNLISVLNEQWNGAWTKNYKDQFEYNASGKLTKELYQRWHESSWENKYQYRFEWEYDTKGNKVSGTRYSFNENKWGKFILYSFSYNEKNQILSKVSKITDNGIDVNDEEHTYSYDEKDRLTQILLRKWHTGKSSWQNSEKTIYEYHENGLKKAEIKADFEKEFWVKKEQKLFTWNVKSQLTETIGQEWDLTGAKWINSSKTNYTYDKAGRLLSETKYWWNETKWVKSAVVEYSYKKN